jgi:hypothetical protein
MNEAVRKLSELKAQAAETEGLPLKLVDEKARTVRGILTHIGVNRNYLELTLDEARKAVQRFKNGKIRMPQNEIKSSDDLHPNALTTIIGGMESIELNERTGGKPRVEFIGRIDDETEWDRKAYKLIKAGHAVHTSYEVDYAEGECSKCGKRFRNGKEICSHLSLARNGMPLGNKTAHIIMHEVKFTGVSVFEPKGADPEAVILAVANLIPTSHEEETMSLKTEEKKPVEAPIQAEAAKKTEVEDLTAKVADLEAQIKDLTAQNKALAEENEKFQAEKKMARVEKIVAMQEARGVAFADDKARKAKVDALMKRSDEYLTDLEEDLAAIPVKEADLPGEPDDDGKTAEQPKGEAAAHKPAIKAVATKLDDVGDKNTNGTTGSDLVRKLVSLQGNTREEAEKE